MKRNENSETTSTEVLEFALTCAEVKSAVISAVPESLEGYSIQVEMHNDGTAYVRAVRQKTIHAPTIESTLKARGDA